MSATVIFFPPYADRLRIVELMEVSLKHDRIARFRRSRSGRMLWLMATPDKFSINAYRRLFDA